LTSIIGKYFLSREDAITLVYGSVMRNLSVALAIALIVFGDNGVEIALIIAVAYVIQVQSAAWYIKFSEKVFGVIPEDVIKDIVEEGLFALHNNLTLYDVIKLLDEEHINSVAILNRKEKIVGLITSQIIINLLADNKSLKTKLSDIKLPTPLQINERTPIKKVLSIMKQKHKYKVLVINQKGKISGVLTKSEIISKFAGEIK